MNIKRLIKCTCDGRIVLFFLQEQKQASLQRKLNKISDTSTIALRCQERKERKRVEAEQLEREREIQRMAGKDRISWVGADFLYLIHVSHIA